MDTRLLREATASDHLRAEAGFPLLHPELDLRTYTRLLLRLYALAHSWDQFVLAHLPSPYVQMAQERARWRLLEADLRALGVAPAIPRSPQLPNFPGVPGILGAMYVMEGSRLGGQLIAKRLQSRFGEELRGACSFFTGFGHETATRWRAFLNVLETEIPDEDGALVIQGAKLMFRAFTDWMAI